MPASGPSPSTPLPPPRDRIAQLPPREKLELLLKTARGKKRALILTHDNPDPDSIAASVALAFILEEKLGLTARVAYGGIIGRSENVAFARLLKLPIAPISQVVFDEYDFLALTDTQPCVGNHSLPARYAADGVIDHHPLRDESLSVPFADVGGDFGATSTMLTEYVRAARLNPSGELATALFYGIKADTRDLGRETTPRDVEAYLWLFPRTDKRLLSQIEHPDLPARYFRMYHKAIGRAKVYGTAVVCDLGEVYSPDMVPELAERLMALEGMKWSLAYGTYRSQLYFSLRTKDRRMNAGRLARAVCDDRGGSAGGHGSMAGARIPLSGSREQRAQTKQELVEDFLKRFGLADERPVALLSATDN